nr:CAZy families GT83 protein [uncultured Bacteroides sp.]
MGQRHVRVVKVYGGVLAVISSLLFLAFLSVKAGLVPETIFQGRHAAQNIAFYAWNTTDWRCVGMAFDLVAYITRGILVELQPEAVIR